MTLDLEMIGDNPLADHIVEDGGKRYLEIPGVGRVELVSDDQSRGFGFGELLSIDLHSLTPIADTLGWSIVANGLYDVMKDGVRRLRVRAQSYSVSPDGVANAVEEAKSATRHSEDK